MAGERSLPGLGLFGFWTPGSNDWDTGMNSNMQLLSAVVQLSVLDRVATLPGSPTDGQIYLMTAGASLNHIVIRDAGAWVDITPLEGWTAWIADEDKSYFFDGTNWVGIYTDAEITALIAASSLLQPILHVRDEKLVGNHGGTSSNVWTTRVLNTVVRNEIAGASLSANQVTLPAGRFEIDASVPAFWSTGVQGKIRNITDGVDLILGTSGYGGGFIGSAATYLNARSRVVGKFDLAGSTVLEIQGVVKTPASALGWGAAAGIDGLNEVFTSAIFRKVA